MAAAASAALEASHGDAAVPGPQLLVACRARSGVEAAGERRPRGRHARQLGVDLRLGDGQRRSAAAAASASTPGLGGIEGGDRVGELATAPRATPAPGRRARPGARRSSPARASAPRPRRGAMTVFSWPSRRVRWAPSCSPSRSSASIASSSSSVPLGARGPPPAVLGERARPRRGGRPLGQVGAAVGELVGERVEALELQQVVGQHAATVRALTGTRSRACGRPASARSAAGRATARSGVDGSGARGSRTSGGTVVPPRSARAA